MHSSGPEFTGAPERLLDLCPGVLFRQRADFSFEYVSPQILQWSGIGADDWLRRADLLPQLVHEADVIAWQRYLAESAQAVGERRHVFRIRNRLTGRITHLSESRRAIRDTTAVLTGFEGVWTDVSMQALAAQQLDAGAWQGAFGLATLGAAHDLNNKLTAILSLSDLYLTEIDRNHPLRDGLAMIKQSAQQASQLLHQLAGLHQSAAGRAEYVDLNQVVSITVDLLRRVVPSRVTIETLLNPEAVAAPIDRIRLQRLIVGWAIHAAARMPKRGAFKLQTRRFERDRQQLAVLSMSDQGRELAVSGGHDQHEPLAVHETPEAMAISQLAGFARDHGGLAEVRSEPSGTTVELILPEGSLPEACRPPGKPWLLLVGMVPEELADLARELESRGMMPVIALEPVTEQLNTNWFSWGGIVIQATVGAAPELLEPIRAQKLSAKIVVCLASGDVSELEPWVASAAELVTPADWPRARSADRIARLFT